MKLAVIGDYNPDSPTHIATDSAIEHAAAALGVISSFEWIATETIRQSFQAATQGYNCFLIAPGSPYYDMQAVLDVIQYARIHNKPVLGTCGGFQHMIIEFARNVLQITDAMHAEYDPYASNLVVNPLSCNLKGEPLQIRLTKPASQVFRIFETDNITESYYCNFGLNPAYQQRIDDAGFHIVGTDNTGEARILELADHPFFIATLFVPQINSTQDTPHKLITALLQKGIKE